jgi:subtilisin family serine protease
VVAQRIASALDDTEADLYVVNMSFALIPCDLILGFADYESQMMDARTARDLNRYRGLFQRAVIFYDDTVFPVMSQRAQSEQDLDPLQALFAARSSNVIPVAAAGNFGLDYPFWPGAWGQVISASASTGQGFYAPGAWDDKKDTPLLDAEVDQPGKQKRISNYGEVMMPGEYADELGLVSGTSFAAPRLSVAMALYASQVGTGYCRKDDGSPALAYGDWNNLTLNEAVQQYCPAMQAYLP